MRHKVFCRSLAAFASGLLFLCVPVGDAFARDDQQIENSPLFRQWLNQAIRGLKKHRLWIPSRVRQIERLQFLTALLRPPGCRRIIPPQRSRCRQSDRRTRYAACAEIRRTIVCGVGFITTRPRSGPNAKLCETSAGQHVSARFPMSSDTDQQSRQRGHHRQSKNGFPRNVFGVVPVYCMPPPCGCHRDPGKARRKSQGNETS